MDASPRENRSDMDDRPVVIERADRPTTANDAPRPLDARRRFVGMAVAVYWTTLIIATHVPVPSDAVSVPGADKAAHFVGYGVLGLLVTLWVALRRELTARVTLLVVLCLAAYAAVDELLQIPVRRSCDFADWVWDVFGASVGAILIALVGRIRPPRNGIR